MPKDSPKHQSSPYPAAGEREAVVQVRASGLHPIVKALASGCVVILSESGAADELKNLPLHI
jgi:hypothetical protein